MFLEINFAQPAAVCLHECIDLLRDLTFIENVTAALGDQSESVRQRRILENVAFAGRASVSVEGISLKKATG